MGTCYSKSGHDVSLPRNEDLKPKEKKRSKAANKNGYPLLVVHDPNSVQKDISDTVYTEDSHTLLGIDMDDLVTKSQQTSLELVTAKDPNKNIETLIGCDKSSCGTCNTDNVVLGINTCTCTTNGTILTSDSGIVMSENLEHVANTDESHGTTTSQNISEETALLCVEQCNNRLSTTSSHSGVAVSKRPDSLPITPCSQTVCACSNSDLTCSSVDGTKTEHSYCFNGECQGHLSHQCNFSSCHGIPSSADHYVHRSSETLLKSSLKKNHTKSRKKKGLSWKSADSLDWAGSTFTCLDRTKSEIGTIFNEDVNLLNAPLATFDSVDFALGSSYDFSRKLRANSCVNYCSDTFQFQFDFSESEGDSKTTADTVERLSESVRNETTTDLDKIKLAIRKSSVTTPTEQRTFSDSLDTSYEFPSVFQQPEVTTMNLNGRDVVVIDADLFTQIVDEIQFLKLKLRQLTRLIEEEVPESCVVNTDHPVSTSPT